MCLTKYYFSCCECPAVHQHSVAHTRNLDYISVYDSIAMGRDERYHRENMFNEFAANLSTIMPEFNDVFMCPTCLTAYYRAALDVDQMLTTGHVVPEAVGGKVDVLECGQCNHHIGSVYDKHVFKEWKQIRWENFEDGTKQLVDVSIGSIKAPAYLFNDGGPGIKYINPLEPRYKELTQVFEEQYNNHKQIHIKISFRSKYLPEMVNISLIHSALLMMFYYFGYEYILIKAAEVARNLIAGKKCAWKPHQLIAVNTEPWPDPLPLVAAIKHPHKIRAFIVALPVPWNPCVSRAVFLPGFGEDGMEAFSRLMDMRKETRKAPDMRLDMNIFNPDPQFRLKFGNCTRFWKHRQP